MHNIHTFKIIFILFKLVYHLTLFLDRIEQNHV